MDVICLLQGKSVISTVEVNLCCCKRDKSVLRYDPLLSRCFIIIMFTLLVIGYNNDTTEFLQSTNHNVMVDFLDEK